MDAENPQPLFTPEQLAFCQALPKIELVRWRRCVIRSRLPGALKAVPPLLPPPLRTPFAACHKCFSCPPCCPSMRI